MDKNRRIRLGMVGGGQGAFIGAVHRLAARMDDQYEFVAGALSSDAERAKASAREIGLHSSRTYTDFKEMAKQEQEHEAGIDVVSIVTPNNMHYPVAKAFLEAGIHVICDKPLTTSSIEARDLQALVKDTDLIFGVTYNYSGYPMIRQAREMIKNGKLGQIRVVQVEYAQDWLSTNIEISGQKQAEWRTDPNRSGSSGSIADIGSHAYHLACFVSGLKVRELAAELTTFVDGRHLDDNANVLLRFEGGARGQLWCSQVAAGNDNTLRIRLFGEKAGLEWTQESPNQLWYSPLGEPKQLITRGGASNMPTSERITRIPAGHPEGYLEAFATLYSDIALEIKSRFAQSETAHKACFPGIDDGADGVLFIEAAVSSSRRNCAWTSVGEK